MKPVELRGITWDHPRGLGGLTAAAEAYRRVRRDIDVRWSARSLQAFADQPLDDLARRFDLLYVDHPAIGHAVARECLLPLDEFIDPGLLGELVGSSAGRSAESYEWEGHRWALATDAAAQVAAYRPDLLDRSGQSVPRTWDEALQAASALRRRGLWVALPAIPVDAICAFLAVCCSLGEEPLGEEGEGVVSRDTGSAALEILASFVSRSHPSGLLWNPPAMLEHMSTENEVAYCPLAFGYSNYARRGFRDHQVRFAGGPTGVAGLQGSTLGGAGLAVSAHARAPEEAARFAAFVASEPIQRGVYFDGGGQPGHRSAWIDRHVNEASGGFFEDTLASVEAAYLRPRYDGFIGFQRESGALVHAFLRNPVDPGPTLARIDEAFRTSMASARK